MKMTPALLVIGGLLVFWASVFIVVFLPAMTCTSQPSDIWRPLDGRGGRRARAVRRQRVQLLPLAVHPHHRLGHRGASGSPRRATTYGQQPAILGTERTGPDLSQEGGEHPDDWHIAHFVNPRYTTPDVADAVAGSSWARTRSSS